MRIKIVAFAKYPPSYLKLTEEVMYLSEIRIKNFRCFDDTEHIVRFHAGLNVLVGENDSGKSAVIDAIRIVLGTTDQGWYRIDSTDFYNEDRLVLV